VAASAVVSAALPVAMLLATWRRFIVPGLTGGVLR
jgi:alpha-glucoside transport system permease protein